MKRYFLALLLGGIAAAQSPSSAQLIAAARMQLGVTRGYDGSYVRLRYPGGDVASDTGVCSDVLVRAFRQLAIDLQKNVHEDMRAAFAEYPQRWKVKAPDSNIDHRRVPNLMTYFKRRGKELPITREGADYRPGDIVAWDLGRGVMHIGIISDDKALSSGRYKVLHNIGRGVEIEDMLFDFRIIDRKSVV